MSLRNFPVFPLLSDSVFSDRFSRIDRLFSQLTGDTPVTMTPPYNLRQLDDEHYALTVSVSGWKESELEMEAAGGRLTVSGRKEEHTENAAAPENDNGDRGISRQDFRLTGTHEDDGGKAAGRTAQRQPEAGNPGKRKAAAHTDRPSHDRRD